MKRVRFSLRALLVGILAIAVVLGVFVRYFQIESQYAVAKERYKALEASYEAGVRYSVMDVVAESFVLFDADRNRWFRGGQAFADQLARLVNIEERSTSFSERALFNDGGHDRAVQTAENIRTLRERFEKGSSYTLDDILKPPPHRNNSSFNSTP